MDIGNLWGVVTLVLLAVFVGVVVWAWSGKRKKAFREAADIPFLDEAREKKAAAESKETRHE